MKLSLGAFPESNLALGRVTPKGVPHTKGLQSSFADLTAFINHLETSHLAGYLALTNQLGHLLGIALIFEGYLVSAVIISHIPLSGEAAVQAFAQRYESNTPEVCTLEFCVLESGVVHALTGVGQRPWKVAPGEFFTGVRGYSDGRAMLYVDGGVVAKFESAYQDGISELGGLSTGTLPAPLRPARLKLPRVVGVWASARYAFTFRGKDAINPITDTYNRTRAAHGKFALETLGRLGRGQTPFEAATGLEIDFTELETLVTAFLSEGLLHRRQDPTM